MEDFKWWVENAWQPPTGSALYSNGDTNGDGHVDILDGNLILDLIGQNAPGP